MILVDSDVLIEHLQRTAAARDWLLAARQSSVPLAISVVSLSEIAGGMRSPERREVMRLLGSMQRFEVTEQVTWRAATLLREYRRSHSGIGLGDYLIAATALTEGLEIATLNIRHYPMFPELARPFYLVSELILEALAVGIVTAICINAFGQWVIRRRPSTSPPGLFTGEVYRVPTRMPSGSRRSVPPELGIPSRGRGYSLAKPAGGSRGP